MTDLDYADLREEIRHLSPNSSGGRAARWVDGEYLGVARGEQDRVEIFLPGPPLVSRLPVVTRLMQHGEWVRRDLGIGMEASRLLLPAGAEYDPIAATLLVELARAGLADDRQRAFSRCEALIELVLQEADLATESVLGLWGELKVLSLWLRDARPSLLPLASWNGYRPSSRDFMADNLGMEVKTTLRSTSSHRVAGVHQVEPLTDDHDLAKEDLRLVSMGVARTAGGESVLDLVTEVERMLEPHHPEHVKEFRVHVADYGARSTGYTVGAENQPPVLQQRYGLTFFRSYDMSDEAILVLRTADLRAHPHVQPDSVTFRVNLPNQVRGDVNPLVGAQALLRELPPRNAL